MKRRQRVADLERAAMPKPLPRWHCIRRYENETQEDAVAAYEAEHGSIGNDNIVTRVIVSKPGKRVASEQPACIRGC